MPALTYCSVELIVSSLMVAETIASTRYTYPRGMARLNWHGCLVTYWGGLPILRWSPVPVLSGPTIE